MLCSGLRVKAGAVLSFRMLFVFIIVVYAVLGDIYISSPAVFLLPPLWIVVLLFCSCCYCLEHSLFFMDAFSVMPFAVVILG